jgi:DNA-directed RNA polymerase specialized sigma subunit
MYLTRKQKEELVIELYFSQNKTYRKIAKEAKVSLRDIHRIIGEESDPRGRF